MECRVATNKQNCPCSAATCANHGTCCDCISSHLATKSLPRCCFPDAQSAKDRSFGSFARAWGVGK